MNSNPGSTERERRSLYSNESYSALLMSDFPKLALDAQEIVECQLFQRGRCHYGDRCKYAHPQSKPLRDRALVHGPAQKLFAEPRPDSPYPLRSGAADCLYYLKTGKCNYGARCKFNHPVRDEKLVHALNRRDCFDFVQKGTCPYGEVCKYNHPAIELKGGVRQGATGGDSRASSPRSISEQAATSEQSGSTVVQLQEHFASPRDKAVGGHLADGGHHVHHETKYSSVIQPPGRGRQQSVDAAEYGLGSNGKAQSYLDADRDPSFGLHLDKAWQLSASSHPLRWGAEIEPRRPQSHVVVSSALQQQKAAQGSVQHTSLRHTALPSHNPGPLTEARFRGIVGDDSSDWNFQAGLAYPSPIAPSPIHRGVSDGANSSLWKVREAQANGGPVWRNNSQSKIDVPGLSPLYEYNGKPCTGHGCLGMGNMTSCSRECQGGLMMRQVDESQTAMSSLPTAHAKTTGLEYDMTGHMMHSSVRAPIIPSQIGHDMRGEFSIEQLHRQEQRLLHQGHGMGYNGFEQNGQLLGQRPSSLFTTETVEQDDLSFSGMFGVMSRGDMQSELRGTGAPTRKGHRIAPSWDELRFGRASEFGMSKDRDGRSRSIDGMRDMWEPTEKSAVFGPGLFGMQHQRFMNIGDCCLAVS